MTWGEGGEGGEGGEPPEEDEGPEEPEVDEEDEGPEEPEVDEEDEGPEEPEVDEQDEGPEEPEVNEEDQGPEEPEVDEEDEERGERLDLFDKVEEGEKAKEDAEEGSQEHADEGGAAERSEGERNEGFSENPEKKEEGEGEGQKELPDERRKTVEGTAEPKREGDVTQEGTKEGKSPDSQFTTSREWGGMKTPGGGWSEYYAETIHSRNEGTGTTSERTSMFARGETDQGDKIMGVGRQDGAEFVARLQNDEGWFDDFFVKIGSAGVFESLETDRPVDASIMKFPPGSDVKTDIRITNNPDLRDLRAFGRSIEFWTDNDGFPTVRTSRWVIFQRDSGEGDGKPLGEGGSRTRLFGYAKTDEFQLRPGKDDVINRKSSFNTFFPLEGGGEGQGVGGNAASSTEGKEGEGTGGSQQGVRILFGDRGNGGPKNDYRFRGESTEVVYRPIGGDAGSKTETGDKISGTTSSVVEGERASEKETAEGAVGKTSETSDEGETSEGVSVGENTSENAAVNEAEETSGVSEAGKDMPAENETAEEAVEETDETSDAGEAKEEDASAEKGNFEDTEESKSKSAEGEEEASVLVEVGEDGERVSSDDALKMVGKGIFRFGGEKEYYEKMGENGVQLDGEKLAKMLFVERKIPKEVYLLLASLGGDDDKSEKSEGEQAPGIKADTEPDAGVVPESSWEEEEKSLENTEETEREPEVQERPEEEEGEEQELGLEDLFTIVQNTLKGIAYSVSKEEFLKLYGEVVKKKGGEEKVAELLRRMKADGAKVEALYDMIKNNEVPLEFFGYFLELVEGAKGIEDKVREIVQKTIELFKSIGKDLTQEQETSAQDSKVGEKSGDGVASSAEEELRKKGYAYVGELIGRLLNEEGLLDSWVFDLVMMRIKEPTQSREGGEKPKDIMERFREVWEGLGMDPKLKLSPIVAELYNWLERRDLLLFVYNGRVDPSGRRGRVVSRVDALETLGEAVRKARGEANFLDVVNKRTGRRFFQYSVDEQLAQGRLDEEILRVAVEYAYEKKEKIDGRWKLLNGNTDYILNRMKEGALFFSRLEGLLEPLAELNRRLEQPNQASTSGEQTSEKSEIPERGTTSPNVAQQGVPEVESEVKTAEEPSAEGVTGESSDSTLELIVQSLMKSLRLEERLRRIYSGQEDGEESGKQRAKKFLKLVFGERNLRYVLELVSGGLIKGVKEGEEEVAMGEVLDEIVEYFRTLLAEAGEMMLNEKIERLSDEEIHEIRNAAVKKYISEEEMANAIIDEYNEMVLERVVETQLGEGGKRSDLGVKSLIEAVETAKQLIEMNAQIQLENETTVPDLKRYIYEPYSRREKMTRYDYYRMCDFLGLPPRNKRACRVDLLRALLKTKVKLEEELTAPGTYLSKGNLQELLTEELRFYEALEEKALRIYNSWDETGNEGLKYLKDIVFLNDLKYTLELFVDKLYALPIPIPSGEAEKIEKATKKVIKEYEEYLERAVEILLNKKGTQEGLRIEKLSDDEVQYILNVAMNKKKQQLGLPLTEDVVPDKIGEQGFLTQLAHEICITPGNLRNYIDVTYDIRSRMTREVYLKICDILGLPTNIRESKHINREDLLEALLKAEEQEGISLDELASLSWYELSSGTCYFNKGDLEKLRDKALECCDGKEMELVKKLQEVGLKYATIDLVERIMETDGCNVETVLALIGVVTNLQLEEVRELVREGEGKPTQAFKSLLEEYGLTDEMNLEWLRNLPGEVVREISLESLAKEILGEMITPVKAQNFLKYLADQGLTDEEFGANHLREVIRENCPESLTVAKEILRKIIAQKEIITPKIAQKFFEYLKDQGLVNETFSVNLPKEIRSELRNAIKNMKSSEKRNNIILTPEELERLRNEKRLSQKKLAEIAGVSQTHIREIEMGLTNPTLSMQQKILNALKDENEKKIDINEEVQEDLYTYASRKIREYTGVEISPSILETALVGFSRARRLSIKHYLVVCEVFGVKPNLSLHYRENRSRKCLSRLNVLRPQVSEIDFPIPMVYKHPSGRTIEIREGEKDFFVVIDGKWLKAKKRKLRYGTEWWGFTVIDYETEEGVYTVVKEGGELWSPLVTPWYVVPLRLFIRFKTPQPLKELLIKIKETLPQLKQIDLAKITGMSTAVLSKIETGKKQTITSGNLLTLIALKSTLTQTDIKREILKIEQEIDKIGGKELSKQRENMLYINLKTTIGAELIGHALADGYLQHIDENRVKFAYSNTEYSNVEDVSKLLKNYGAKGTIHSIEEIIVDGKKHKDVHYVSAGGLIAYALYRAIPQAVGNKTKNNPKAPSEIIKDPKLARSLAKAMIKDEANIDKKQKDMTVEMYVSVTKKLKDRKHEILATAEEQVEERKKERGGKLTRMEEIAARHVDLKEVSEETVELAETVPCNTLLSLREALQTLGIKTIDKGIQNFYASENEDVTACWRMYVSNDETEKAYELELLTGSKKDDYEARYKTMTKRIKLIEPKRNVWKLSIEQVAKLEKRHEKYRQEKGEEAGYIPFSEIENDSDFGEIVRIIRENAPEKLEKKWLELGKKGIKTPPPKPRMIWFGKKMISVEWLLEWFET